MSRKSCLTCLVLGVILCAQVACAEVQQLVPMEASATPALAAEFGYPLDPGRFGPYVHGVSGPLNVDTRFGVQNPALGDETKCFQDRGGRGVPFRELFHAGVDWFKLDGAGQVDTAGAAGEPVRAVARGVVYMTQQIGDQGWILILAHRLAGEGVVYSAYWHVSRLQVGRGDGVERGQVVAQVHDMGLNSHLHWEIRDFGDGSQLFAPDTAGGRGRCNGHAAGVAYTWDDDPTRARPEYWGYFDPMAFVESHRP